MMDSIGSYKGWGGAIFNENNNDNQTENPFACQVGEGEEEGKVDPATPQ